MGKKGINVSEKAQHLPALQLFKNMKQTDTARFPRLFSFIVFEVVATKVLVS